MLRQIRLKVKCTTICQVILENRYIIVDINLSSGIGMIKSCEGMLHLESRNVDTNRREQK